MAKAKLRNQCLRAKTVLHLIEKFTSERKALYEELDGLIVELRDFPELAGEGLAIRNAFAKGNTQWGHGPVRQFTLELLEASPVEPPAAATKSEGTRKRKRSEKSSE